MRTLIAPYGTKLSVLGSLSDVHQALTDAAMIVYESGDEPGAAQILANLRAAPKVGIKSNE
jgi:hypothetical protein